MKSTKRLKSPGVVLTLSALLTGSCVTPLAWSQSYPNSLWIGTDNNAERQTLNTDRSGTVLRSAALGEVTGIAIDAANNRIFLGTSEGTITPYDLATLAPGTSIRPNAGIFWEDMAFDGTTIWRADVSGNRVYQINPRDGTVVSSFEACGRPMGVAWDGAALWVSDQFTGVIAKYSTNGTSLSQQFNSGLAETGGLAYDATDCTLWVGTYHEVHHYSTNGVELGSFAFTTDDPFRFADGLEFQGAGGPRLNLDFYAGITIEGTVGSTNRIEYVTNLENTLWTTLTNLVLPQSPFLFFDLTSARTERRFYRAVQVE